MNNKLIVLLCMLFLLTPNVFGFFVSLDDSDPKPAEAGKFLNVWIRVENPDLDEGTNELYLEVIETDGFTLAPGEESRKRIGVLSAYAYKVIPFRLQVNDNALEGINILQTKITDGNGIDISQDLLIEVEEKDILDVDLSVGSLDSDPLRIKPGDEEVKIDVTLLNLGDADAKSVKINLVDLPDELTPSNSYDDTALIGTITEDGQGVATFYIDVEEDAGSKKYDATLDVSYKYKPDEDEDDFVIEYVKIPVEIDVKAIPYFEITDVQFDRETLSIGDEKVKMTLTIKNTGEKKGEYVRVKAFTKTEQPFSFDVSSDFVSPFLEPGQSAQATLEFDIDADSDLQEYQMELEIKTLLDEDVLTYQRKVPVAVTGEEKKSMLPLIAVIIVIVAVGIFFFTRSRNSKKRKK